METSAMAVACAKNEVIANRWVVDGIIASGVKYAR